MSKKSNVYYICYECGKETDNPHTNSEGEDVCPDCCDVCKSLRPVSRLSEMSRHLSVFWEAMMKKFSRANPWFMWLVGYVHSLMYFVYFEPNGYYWQWLVFMLVTYACCSIIWRIWYGDA